MKAAFQKYVLEFKQPAGTSRGVLKTKNTWFLMIDNGVNKGIGEVNMFAGLSIDDRPDFEEKLQWTCDHSPVTLLPYFLLCLLKDTMLFLSMAWYGWGIKIL